MFVGAAEILLGDEFFTRGEQVGTDIALVPDVAVGDELFEPVPALPEKARVFAAVPRHPGNEVRPRIGRRARIPVIGDRHIRAGGRGEGILGFGEFAGDDHDFRDFHSSGRGAGSGSADHENTPAR